VGPGSLATLGRNPYGDGKLDDHDGFQYADIALEIIGLAAAWNYRAGVKAYALLAAPFALLTGFGWCSVTSMARREVK